VRKRVLQFFGSFHQGGSERQAVQLTRLLKGDGSHDVYVATLNNEGVLRADVEALGLPEIAEFKLTSFYDANFIRQVRCCASYVKENKIDLVHTHDFYTNVFGMAAAALAGVKVRIASKRETGGMRTKPQEFVEKLAFGRAHTIVANSGAVKNYLIDNGVPDKKIKVIYNGLDLDRLTPRTLDRKSICENLGLPPGEDVKLIVLVANLRHQVKNHPMFLRAAVEVVQKFPMAHFVLAGEGELCEDLQKLARDLKIVENVHFTGPCTDVPDLLSISSVCVLTSFNEGFSNSILEYMAAGKPVVATRVGGANEAIIENETGFLVDSDDDTALAGRLIDLLQNEEKAREFGEKGRQIVVEKFSLASQLENTLKLYAEQ